MMAFLSAGVLLGISAGFSPGPLFALVLSQTLQHGIKEGCKVAAAPLITDVPVIIASLLLLRQLSDFKTILGVVSLAGAVYLAQMAYETIRCGFSTTAYQGGAPQSLSRGMLVNLLSPHPYLFWITVGAPTIFKAVNGGTPLGAPAFVGSFLGSLVGAKIILAIVVGKSRSFLTGALYHGIMRVLGVLLLAFAFLLGREGCSLLGFLHS